MNPLPLPDLCLLDNVEVNDEDVVVVKDVDEGEMLLTAAFSLILAINPAELRLIVLVNESNIMTLSASLMLLILSIDNYF